MKKYVSFFLVLVITLSFCGCNNAKNNNTEIKLGTKDGIAYFEINGKAPEIIISSIEVGTEDIRITDDDFCDKLINAVDKKNAGDDFCYCLGDYQLTIDNKYTIRLHEDKFVIISNTKEFDDFTVKCSKEETKELYDIIKEAT